MSKQALFKNAFQQIKRLWDCYSFCNDEIVRLEKMVFPGIYTGDTVEIHGQTFNVPKISLESQPEREQEVHDTDNTSIDITKWSLGNIVHELVAIGAGYSSYDQADMAGELVRRMTEAASDTGIVFGTDEKGNGVAGGTFQPALAPEASDSLFVHKQSEMISPNGHKYISHRYLPATLPQIRQAAVDAGLLDTPRQKVAEAFLHAALGISDEAGQEPYKYGSPACIFRYWSIEPAITKTSTFGETLANMAAVLEAAKEHNEDAI